MVPQGYGQQDRNGARQQRRRTRQMAGAAVVAREPGVCAVALMLAMPAVMPVMVRTGALWLMRMRLAAHAGGSRAMFRTIRTDAHCFGSAERLPAEWHRRRGPALRR